MVDLDQKTTKRIIKKLRKLGFDAFFLFAVQRDPADKTQFFTTATSLLNSQEELEALGNCMKESMEARPAMIIFIQAIVDELTAEIKLPPSPEPLFPS